MPALHCGHNKQKHLLQKVIAYVPLSLVSRCKTPSKTPVVTKLLQKYSSYVKCGVLIVRFIALKCFEMGSDLDNIILNIIKQSGALDGA